MADAAPPPPPNGFAPAQRRWMSDTLKLHLDPPFATPPAGPAGTLPPVPNFQLPDPTLMPSPPPPTMGMPPLTPPLGQPAQAKDDAPAPTLSRDGVEIEAEATRPASPGPVQLFPSARITARTPYLGGAVGPDVRGPVTSAEAGATVLQVGNDDLNAQLRASIEHGPDGNTPHATVHVEAKVGPVNIQVEGDTTPEGKEISAGIGGRF